MSDELTDELVDAGPIANGEVPQVVKTLSILSIVGNSVMMLLILVGMLYILALGSAFGGVLGGAIGILVVSALIAIALNVVGLIGAIKMGKGQKGAFIMYAIATGIWALMFLYSGLTSGDMWSILFGLSSAGFIVAFGMQMKNMPG